MSTNLQSRHHIDSDKIQMDMDYTCPEKQEWRRKMIYGAYCQFTRRKSIPKNKTYWTMPNKIRDGETDCLLKGCEFDQMITAGLVKPEQCHGVELIRDIYEDNRKVKAVHSYCGDFFNVLNDEAHNNRFDPAVLVYDSIVYPQTHTDYFPALLDLVTECGIDGVLVVWNFVIKAAYHDLYDVQKMPDFVSTNKDLNWAIVKAANQGKPWGWGRYCHWYRGSGKGNQSGMATVLFFR